MKIRVKCFLFFSAPPLGSANNLHKVIFVSKSVHEYVETNIFSKSSRHDKSYLDSFCEYIASIDWCSTFSCSDVEEAVHLFYEHLENALSIIPVSYVKVGPKKKPWITPVLLDLINKRWRAFRKKKTFLCMFIIKQKWKKK